MHDLIACISMASFLNPFYNTFYQAHLKNNRLLVSERKKCGEILMPKVLYKKMTEMPHCISRKKQSLFRTFNNY